MRSQTFPKDETRSPTPIPPPAAYGEHVQKWRANDARIVGGCCEVGPKLISYLRDVADRAAGT